MSESALERYERLAEAFYRETGIMAPGKDVPAALGKDDYAERFDAFRAWCRAAARRSATHE